jgi:three-Cys-motif partner protein
MSPRRIEIPTLEDDGLFTPEVGDWAEDKYRLVTLYASLFTTAMQGKWDELVYIDLFSGAGRSRVRGTRRIVPASPLLALGLAHRFDRYVFCDANPERMRALSERVQRDFSEVDARFVQGDVNLKVAAILAELPKPTQQHRVLGFCFADPYSLRNLRFETISALAGRFIDFLVLIPTGVDATRNEGIYLRPANPTIDRFLGNLAWREEWDAAKETGQTFDRFMTDALGHSMQGLGYIYEGIDSTQLVKSTERRLRLYRLAMFSRHPLGSKFWREVRKYVNPQGSLPF